MEQFNMPLQLLVSGLAIGSIYALVALGFVLTYVSVNVVNFAQGDFTMMGAFVAFTLVVGGGLPVWAGLLIGIVIIGGIGYLFQLSVYRPFVKRNKAFFAGDDQYAWGVDDYSKYFLNHLRPLPAEAVSAF